MTDDLFPKPKRRMKQPTKDALRALIAQLQAELAQQGRDQLREQLALAADVLIAERERAERWQRAAETAFGAPLAEVDIDVTSLADEAVRTDRGIVVAGPPLNPIPNRAPWWLRIFRRYL